MVERSRLTAQLPARRSLYESPELASALPIPLDQVRQVLEAAVPRPATPVYSELSEILQVRIHRALTGQQPPAEPQERGEAPAAVVHLPEAQAALAGALRARQGQ